MLRTCCVLGCGVTTAQDIIFFDFPTSRLLRQRWLNLFTPVGKITTDSALCSKHFAKNDYEYIRGKVRLKRKVVPTLHLNSTNESPEKNTINENAKSNNNIKTTESEIKDTGGKSKKSTKKNIDKICESLISKSNKTDSKIDDELVDTNGINADASVDTDGIAISDKTDKQSESNNVHSDKNTEIDDSDKVCSASNNIDKCGINSNKSNASDNCGKNVSDKCAKISDRSGKISESSDKIGTKRKKTAAVSTTPGKVAGSGKNKGYYGIGVNNIDLSDDSGTDSASEVSLLVDKNATNQIEPEKQDIEELLTNYQIVNTKPNRLASPVNVPSDGNSDVQEIPIIGVIPVIPVQAAPVFIEIAVGQEGPARNDCMLVMESVQVELDPATLMLPEREDDTNREDPISLLTSSDEDDVILQEPKIDTVEVSSETDEDDVPLVKLAKTNSPNNLAKIFWGLYEYYCLQCKYTTTSKGDYNRHLKTHETVLHMCQSCGYTTASKTQLERHSKKHSSDKKFKCHLCDFKAKYNMSLIYHMKCHSKVRTVDLCGRNGRKKRKYTCNDCNYTTFRSSDLKRHRTRKHCRSGSEDESHSK